jgi:hypothetical protein
MNGPGISIRRISNFGMKRRGRKRAELYVNFRPLTHKAGDLGIVLLKKLIARAGLND